MPHNFCLFCLQLAIVIMAILLGILIIGKPKRIIKMQINFYRLINWKIEPISMTKEIRNTRLMGATVFTLGIVSLIYIIMQRL